MSRGNGKGRPRQGDPNPSNVQNLDTPEGTPAPRQDHLAARADRDTGAALADAAAGAWWRSTADAAIRYMADTGQPFTVDTMVATTGLPEATTPRAMGARILAAARAGVIEGVGYTTSSRPGARCAVVRVWRAPWAVSA